MRHKSSPRTLDVLRVYGLSRIPRCGRCPRLRALRLAQEGSLAAPVDMPAVPSVCHHEVCAPLIERYEPLVRRERLAG